MSDESHVGVDEGKPEENPLVFAGKYSMRWEKPRPCYICGDMTWELYADAGWGCAKHSYTEQLKAELYIRLVAIRTLEEAP